MSKDDKAIFYHKPQTFQWTPADGVFSFGENRKEQNMIRYYSVPKETFITNGTIVEPLNVTENGTYAPPAGTAYSPVVVNVEGGGGSSDFSTAEVTAINNMSDDFNVFNSINIVNGAMQSEAVLSAGTNNLTAVLYKNTAQWMFTTGTVSVTGSATVETTHFGAGVTITGDCTITIS